MGYARIRPKGCYVYIHRRASDLKVFYVGKGTRERAWDQHGRNLYWRRVAAKHGVVVEIVVDGLDGRAALDSEIETIAKYAAEGAKLVNMTGGGEGALFFSAETRAKIGAAHRGKPKSEETRRKISESNRGQKRSEEAKAKMRGRIYSEETRRKMSESRRNSAPPTQETREKLAVSTARRWEDPEYRAKMSEMAKGIHRGEEFRQKMQEISRKRPPMTPEQRENVRLKMQQKWADPEYRARMSAAHSGTKWSEARRAAHNPETAHIAGKLSRVGLTPERRSEIASIAAKAGVEKRRSLRAAQAQA